MKSLLGTVSCAFSRTSAWRIPWRRISTSCEGERISRIVTPASSFSVSETSWPLRIPSGSSGGLIRFASCALTDPLAGM